VLAIGQPANQKQGHWIAKETYLVKEQQQKRRINKQLSFSHVKRMFRRNKKIFSVDCCVRFFFAKRKLPNDALQVTFKKNNIRLNQIKT